MLGFVFAGQGPQKPGMGLDLYKKSKKAKEFIDLTEDIQAGIKDLCFNGPQDKLNITINTQPCVFTVAYAGALAMEEKGVKADLVAGFSLGEIGALTYSKVLEEAEAIRLVHKRAKFMEEASKEREGSMLAVLGLSRKELLHLIGEYRTIEAVNFNCKGQIVISGSKMEIDSFVNKHKKLRTRPLAVSGAFHSKFMESASEKMTKYLEGITLYSPKTDVYSNYNARVYPEEEREIKEIIAKQISRPVRWEEVIVNMIERGAREFIELGEGQVLSGLIKRINKEVTVRHYSEFIN